MSNERTISDVLGNALLSHIAPMPNPLATPEIVYHMPCGLETVERGKAKDAWLDEAVRDANRLFALTRMPNETYSDLIRLRHRAENDMRNLFDTVYPI